MNSIWYNCPLILNFIIVNTNWFKSNNIFFCACWISVSSSLSSAKWFLLALWAVYILIPFKGCIRLLCLLSHHFSMGDRNVERFQFFSFFDCPYNQILLFQRPDEINVWCLLCYKKKDHNLRPLHHIPVPILPQMWH